MIKPLFAILCLLSCSAPAFAGGRHFDRIITVIMENVSYNDALKDPYLKSVARRSAFLANYHAVFHPSYPNYLAMTGGNYFSTFLDTQRDVDADNITDLLEAKGYTWKGYAEDYPGNCFLGDSGLYARKHVPLLSYIDINRNPVRCANQVNASEFYTDWAAGTLPNYSFFSPNLNDDGHNTGVTVGSNWLKGFLEPLLADTARMAGTLIFVTFDESDHILDSNRVFAAALGPMVKAGSVSRRHHTHYDHLVLVEDNFGLDNLGVGDDPTIADVHPINEIWR